MTRVTIIDRDHAGPKPPLAPGDVILTAIVFRYDIGPTPMPAQIVTSDGEAVSRLDCPYCETWEAILLDPRCSDVDDPVRYLVCEGCGGRVVVETEEDA